MTKLEVLFTATDLAAARASATAHQGPGARRYSGALDRPEPYFQG